MATKNKSNKFDAKLNLENKVDQVLSGLEYSFSALLQERITEVFNQNDAVFKDFCEWIFSPEGSKYLSDSNLSSAYLLKELLTTCLSQFDDDLRNGSYSSISDTASYYFNPSHETIDYKWNEFNFLK